MARGQRNVRVLEPLDHGRIGQRLGKVAQLLEPSLDRAVTLGDLEGRLRIAAGDCLSGAGHG